MNVDNAIRIARRSATRSLKCAASRVRAVLTSVCRSSCVLTSVCRSSWLRPCFGELKARRLARLGSTNSTVTASVACPFELVTRLVNSATNSARPASSRRRSAVSTASTSGTDGGLANPSYCREPPLSLGVEARLGPQGRRQVRRQAFLFLQRLGAPAAQVVPGPAGGPVQPVLDGQQPSGHDRLTVRTAHDPPKGRHLDRVATACAEPIGSNRSKNFTGRRLGRRRMAKRSARGASSGFHRHGRRTWSMSLVFILGRDLTSNGGSRANLQIREPTDDQPVVAGSVEAKARAANVVSTSVQGSQLHRG